MSGCKQIPESAERETRANGAVFKSHKQVAMVAERMILYADDDLVFGTAALVNSFSAKAAALPTPPPPPSPLRVRGGR